MTLEIYLYMEKNIVHTYGRNIFLCLKGFRKKIRSCTKSLNLLSPSPLSFTSHNPRSEVNRSACRVACEHGYLVWVLRAVFWGIIVFFPFLLRSYSDLVIICMVTECHEIQEL